MGTGADVRGQLADGPAGDQLYEIHASDNRDWNDNTLRAALAGWDNGSPVSTFDLSLLAPFGIGPNCYVTVRSVSKDNIASGYGTPCWWEGR